MCDPAMSYSPKPFLLLCAQVDHALADLILKLLCWDPAKRLSTIDALLHPFFDALSPMRHLLQVRAHELTMNLIPQLAHLSF